MKNLIASAFLAFIILFPSPTTTEVTRLDSLTDDEINALSKEQLAELPYFALMNRMVRSISEGFDTQFPVLVLEVMLYELRYYDRWPTGMPSEEFKHSIRSFQSDIGHDSTGMLLFGEFSELERRFDLVTAKNPIWLPSSFVYGNSDIAKASGTWIFSDGSAMADPIQTSQLECSRQTMICRETTASVSANTPLLSLYSSEMTITKWTTSEIVAKDDSPLCVSYTLSINLVTKKTTKFRRSTGGKSCQEFAFQPQAMELVNGDSVWNKVKDDLIEQRRSVYNDDYQDKLTSLVGPADSK